MKKTTIITREEWLVQATALLAPHFTKAGFTLPKNVRMTCGFPSTKALSPKKRRIGECWSAESSGDKHFEIFISPTLDDPMEVLGVLVHELCHATMGLKEGHTGKFVKAIRALLLEGKPSSTTVGDEFIAQIGQPVLKALPAYPHKKLIATVGEKKQTTRLLKCVCPECGYTVRTTATWLQMGAPVCPVDEVSMEEV